MNRDDIIRMAQEAGIPIDVDWAGRPSTLVVKDGGTYLRGVDDLMRFAALVAAEEREALKEERRRDMAEICSLRESEESLREENERLRADAERYRWLREESKKHPDFYSGEARWMVSCAQGGMGHNFFGEKIDAAIDAAMKRAAQQKEGQV